VIGRAVTEVVCARKKLGYSLFFEASFWKSGRAEFGMILRRGSLNF
jgi:hypothetical protein